MAIFRAAEQTIKRLVQLPESGMGFQILRHDGEYWVAFISSILMPFAELRESTDLESNLARIFHEEEADAMSSLEELNLSEDLSLAFSHLDISIRDATVGLASPDRVSGPTPGLLASRRPISLLSFRGISARSKSDQKRRFHAGYVRDDVL